MRVLMATLSVRYAERLITRFGARRTLLPGLGLIAVGLALFARIPVDATYLRDVLPVMLLIGAGVGVSFPALTTLAMSGATASDAGLASGLVNTSVEVGGALGLAVLATVSATRTRSLLHAGQTASSALTGGYHLAFVVAALLVVAAIAVAVRVLPTRRPAEVVALDMEPGAEELVAC